MILCIHSLLDALAWLPLSCFSLPAFRLLNLSLKTEIDSKANKSAHILHRDKECFKVLSWHGDLKAFAFAFHLTRPLSPMAKSSFFVIINILLDAIISWWIMDEMIVSTAWWMMLNFSLSLPLSLIHRKKKRVKLWKGKECRYRHVWRYPHEINNDSHMMIRCSRFWEGKRV